MSIHRIRRYQFDLAIDWMCILFIFVGIVAIVAFVFQVLVGPSIPAGILPWMAMLVPVIFIGFGCYFLKSVAKPRTCTNCAVEMVRLSVNETAPRIKYQCSHCGNVIDTGVLLRGRYGDGKNPLGDKLIRTAHGEASQSCDSKSNKR